MNFDELTYEDVVSWPTALKVISLEWVEHFGSAMGLDLKPAEWVVVREEARRFSEEYWMSENTVDTRALLQDSFEEITRQSSEHTTRKLMRWGTSYLRASSQGLRPAFTWGALFRRLADLPSTKTPLVPMELTGEKKRMLVEIVVGLYSEKQSQRDSLDEQQSSPPTAWEARLLETYELPSGPYDFVADVMRWHVFNLAYSEIGKLLNDQEMRTLTAWGKKQAAEMGIPVELVDDLAALQN